MLDYFVNNRFISCFYSYEGCTKELESFYVVVSLIDIE